MVNSILKRFPSLINESSDFNHAYSLWHSRIMSYFKNHRFRTSTDIPEIIQKKKIYGKRKDDAVVQNGSTFRKICFGVQNFLPDLPEGEDAHTWEKYQKELQNQMTLTKEKRIKESVRQLMEKTFPNRRHIIVKEFIRLKDLLEMYPALCTEDQVDNITNFLISNLKGKSCILKIQSIILVGPWTAHISCNFISIFLTFKIQVVHDLQVSLQIHIWKVVY